MQIIRRRAAGKAKRTGRRRAFSTQVKSAAAASSRLLSNLARLPEGGAARDYNKHRQTPTTETFVVAVAVAVVAQSKGLNETLARDAQLSVRRLSPH